MDSLDGGPLGVDVDRKDSVRVGPAWLGCSGWAGRGECCRPLGRLPVGAAGFCFCPSEKSWIIVVRTTQVVVAGVLHENRELPGSLVNPGKNLKRRTTVYCSAKKAKIIQIDIICNNFV